MKRSMKKSPILLFIFSFFLPVILSGLCFALKGVSPFGDRTVLRSDAWAQYHPFLVEFRNILLRGGSLEHTWSMGMGINFAPMYAYYLSSPLYLLCVFVPDLYLAQFMTIMTMVKLGLAGLFFTYYLSKIYRRKDITMAFFGLLYALCAWVTGYYWCIIWLDVFALLPILVLGTIALLKEGKFRLYTLALALCFWCNYYLSFCCCVFVLLCFLGYHLSKKTAVRELLRSFLRFAVCTLLAAAMVAVLLIPTLLGMQQTASVKSPSFSLFALCIPDSTTGFQLVPFLKGLLLVLSRNLPNSTPTYMEGLPNLFCGFSVFSLGLYALCCKEVSRRERMVYGSMLIFLVISCILVALNFFWHGFHFPNMIPYRFSFLYSFCLLSLAYRGWTLLGQGKLRRLLIPLGLCLTLMVGSFLFYEELSFGYFSLLLSVGILLAVGLIALLRSKVPLPKLSSNLRHRLASILLCCIFLCEAGLSAYSGMDKGIAHSFSTPHIQNGQSLVSAIDAQDTEVFYRIGETVNGTSNDGALHHCNGVGIFSSSALFNFSNFASALGLRAWAPNNSFQYTESAPPTDLLCGIKYLVSVKDSYITSTDRPVVAESGDYVLLSNPSYIGVGFMMDSEAADFVSYEDNKDPLAEQSTLLSMATGLDVQLYRPIYDPELSASENCTLEPMDDPSRFYYTVGEGEPRGQFTISYTMEEAGLFCIATRMQGGKDMVIYKNGEKFYTTPVYERGILSLGQVVPGDVFDMCYTSEDYREAGISLRAAMYDPDAFASAMEKLADEVWTIESASDTQLSGSITVKEEGLFYTSIPYEPGWTAYVDGVEVPLAQSYDPRYGDVKLTDGVVSFPLSAGAHHIRLEYRSPGLRIGLAVSLCAIGIYIVLIFFKKPTLFPPLPESKKEIAHED
ncbi:MAG: YfhO family protein [Oscillospiraceae bacterium]|nr:YfhO family protein [Oscillospiraceae bacterium]